MKPVHLIIAGGGNRGTTYAAYALSHPDQAKVVGVAEPRDHFRNALAKAHAIPAENAFADWRAMAARPKFADAVIVSTLDDMHREPAEAFADKKYAMLLEKPMGLNEDECRRIHTAVKRNHILFGVCHVLRYTRYTRMLKEILDSGEIGAVVCLQHLEPVGYWHQGHSFVRGNWRNEAQSSPMLLAKSCHDLDWVRHIMNAPCKKVSSFGALKHFRREEQPKGAGERCLDCPAAIESNCPYSAKKLYLKMLLEHGKTGWPLSIITTDFTVEGVTAALRDGPYGRCVYACDNDAVDNQVVNMEFEGGKTATFTMTAFTRARDRQTSVFGTRGEITGDGDNIQIYDFLTDKTRTVDTTRDVPGALAGHGGGDYGLMQAFTKAVAENDQSLILSGPDETLETHRMVFLAEKSRRENKVVEL
ncbi:MAG: Gfo/Idh/MocA family oxidoreductase [Candidatus Sumerlaeota bacterium]|nr:Gfo/Idh/MocA family oxidoreductase [Candidatus Sumerlaeota bacterium]